jgi:DNA-binding MarR family transcriptional regulator
VPEELSEEESAAYQALMRVVFALPRAITADINPACGVALSDYMALDLLSRAPGGQLRMTGLAAACGVSLSGISRIMNRLDREGLTRREGSPDDKRGTFAMLTDAGQASLEKTYPLHLASTRRYVFEHLGAFDLAQFTAVMESIADALLAGGAARSDRRWRPASAFASDHEEHPCQK